MEVQRDLTNQEYEDQLPQQQPCLQRTCRQSQW